MQPTSASRGFLKKSGYVNLSMVITLIHLIIDIVEYDSVYNKRELELIPSGWKSNLLVRAQPASPLALSAHANARARAR
jgi:hypothetical protein